MEAFTKKTHVFGRFWMITALFGIIMIPVAISSHLDAWPQASTILEGLAPMALLFYPSAVIEVITYTPMLGAGASYISFVTGNVANLKLPCALAAMDNAKVNVTSDEGEILSTIATASSAIITTILIAIGVVAFGPFLPYLTAEGSPVSAAFSQVLPALFGALGMSYIAKNWKISIAPIAVVLLCLVVDGSIGSGILIAVGVVVALVATEILWKLGVVK